MSSRVGVQTWGSNQQVNLALYPLSSSFRLGETLNWNYENAGPRSVKITSKGRSVLKSITHFTTDALNRKVSPELGH